MAEGKRYVSPVRCIRLPASSLPPIQIFCTCHHGGIVIFPNIFSHRLSNTSARQVFTFDNSIYFCLALMI
jgi:hypothetical protein